MKIQKEIAIFIADQIGGEVNGQMAPVPNNPVLSGLVKAYGLRPFENGNNNIGEYAEFFKAVSEALQSEINE